VDVRGVPVPESTAMWGDVPRSIRRIGAFYAEETSAVNVGEGVSQDEGEVSPPRMAFRSGSSG